MTLYCWRSQYLENYAPGHILVVAEDVEAARNRARCDFAADLRDRHEWLFAGLSNHEILADENLCAKRAKFEAEIAAEPEILTGTLYLAGSE